MANNFFVKIIGQLDKQKTKRNLNSEISSLDGKLKKVNLDATLSKGAISSLKKQLKNIDMSISKQSVNNIRKQISDALKGINVSIDTSGKKTSSKKVSNEANYDLYASKVNKLSVDYQKFGYSISQTEEKLRTLNKAYREMVNAPSDKRIEKERIFQTELRKSVGELQKLKSVYASVDAKTKVANSIKTYMNINTAVSREAKQELMSLVATLENSDNLSVPALNNIKSAFERIKMSEREAGNLGKSFFNTISDGAKKFVSWGIATRGVMLAWMKVRDAGKAVYDIDTAMTSLYKVTEATDSQYTKFLTNASKNAKDLGRNVSSLVEQTAEWAKGGYKLNDSSNLAQVSSIYSNVGEVDDSTAVKNIVSTLKGFNLEADKAINVVDDLNILGKVMLPLTNYIG